MAKGKKSIFFCQNCGHEEAKWLGQCPVCKEWNTFAEEKVSAGLSRGTTAAAKQSKTAEVVPLSQISAEDDTRMITGMNWTECLEEESSQVLSFWSEGTRGLENQPCYCKCVRGCRHQEKFYIFQERSRRLRSNCVQIVWEVLQIICCCYVKQIWIPYVLPLRGKIRSL